MSARFEIGYTYTYIHNPKLSGRCIELLNGGRAILRIPDKSFRQGWSPLAVANPHLWIKSHKEKTT